MASISRSDSRSTSRSNAFKSRSSSLETIDDFERIAGLKGLEPPKEKRRFSTLRKVGGVLNIGTATVAGAIRGLLRDDVSVFQGIKEGIRQRETFGFKDIFEEDLRIKPTTRAGKIALGVGSFIADVLFDPLTYITLGAAAGIKVGGKVITKTGTKLAQEAGRGIIAKRTRGLLKKGVPLENAERIAGQRVTGVVNDLMQRTFGKKGVTDSAAREFVGLGVSQGTIDVLRQLGPAIIDNGGIKYFGKTIVTSEKLGQTLVGKAARRLGETEIVTALRNTLGKLFFADFKKNKALVQIIEKASRQQKRAIDGIVKANEDLFRALSDDEMSTLFHKIFEKKKTVAEAEEAVPGILAEATKEELGPRALRKGVPTEKTIAKVTQEARAEAKELLKGQKLTLEDFDGNEKLLAVSDKLFEGNDAIIPKFAKAAGISEKEAIKFYIPSKFQDKLLVKDFAVGRNLSSPSFGFRKKFTGVDDERLIRDPFEAFSRGQTEVVTARIKDRAFRSTMNALGSKVEREGLVKVTRKGIDGKLEGWFMPEIAKEINEFLTPSPKLIDDLARLTGFDWATGLFKGYVTSLFPGFHFRNITSNQFLNMIKIGTDVLNPKLQLAALQIVRGKSGQKLITTKTGKRVSFQEIRDQVAKESDILDASGPFGRLEQFLDDSRRSLSRTSLLKSINPLSRENIALKRTRQFGSKAEAQAKMVSVLSAVMEGKGVKQGIKQAEEALFNYGKLSSFEKSVMRRVIPFYTFARKNMEFQLRALATKPGLVSAQIKAFRNASTAISDSLTQDDLEGLPDFILDHVGLKAGVNQYGQDRYYTGFGLPIEEFLEKFSGEDSFIWNTVRNLLKMSNPIIKFPLERASGTDFFRDRPITELTNGEQLKAFIALMPESVATEFKRAVQYTVIKDGKDIHVKGKVVGTEDKITANPFALHLFRNLPTSRIFSTVGFIADEQEGEINKAIKFFTGIRNWSIDKETQDFFNDLRRKDQLTEWLTRMGIIYQGEFIGETKNKNIER